MTIFHVIKCSLPDKLDWNTSLSEIPVRVRENVWRRVELWAYKNFKIPSDLADWQKDRIQELTENNIHFLKNEYKIAEGDDRIFLLSRKGFKIFYPRLEGKIQRGTDFEEWFHAERLAGVNIRNFPMIRRWFLEELKKYEE